jgi:hypothetical protein
LKLALISFYFAVFICRSASAQTIGESRSLPSDWFGCNAFDVTKNGNELNNNGNVLSNWKKIKMQSLRHSANGNINDWDWLKGYYLSNGRFPAAGNQFDINSHANKFSDLQLVRNTMGASIMFAMNPVGSTKNYEMAGLSYALGIGLPVNKIEIGEEIYGTSFLNNDVFPSAAAYGDLCEDWLNTIHTQFPGMKVGIVGAPTDGDVRKIGWNVDVLTSMDLSGSTKPDALILHYYPSSGLQSDHLEPTEAELQTMFENVYYADECIKNDIRQAKKIQSDLETWITEYNLTDRGIIIHGSWAHALFATMQTLLMMEDETITQVMLDNASSDGVRGLLFQNIHGLNPSSYDRFIAPYSDENQHNEEWQYTALGNSMRLVTEAMSGMSYAYKVNIPGAPSFPGDPSHKTIYATAFGDASSWSNCTTKNVIVLNMNSTLQDFGLSFIDGNIINGIYEQLYHNEGTYQNQVFVGGNAVFGSFDYVTTPGGYPTIHTTLDPANPVSSSDISSTTLSLKPYSVTYIRYSASNPQVTPSTSICSGQSAILVANGGCSYTWSPATGLDVTTGNRVSAHPSATTTYSVTVKDCLGNTTVKTEVVTVSSTPSFTVTQSNSGNCDLLFTATPSTYCYVWAPGNSTGNTLQVLGSSMPASYVVTAADGTCTAAQTITASKIYGNDPFLQIINLNQAYKVNCDKLKFKYDLGSTTKIYGSPFNNSGYFQIKKIPLDGGDPTYATITHDDLVAGKNVFCDVAGKYEITYSYDWDDTGPCATYTLKQTVFVVRPETEATVSTFCPEFVLKLNKPPYDAGDTYYWDDGTQSLLYTNSGATIPYTNGDPADKVYFMSPNAGIFTVTIGSKNGSGTTCGTSNFSVNVSDKCTCTSADNNYRFVDIKYSQLLALLDQNAVQCNSIYKGSTLDNNGVLYFFGTFTIDQEASFLNTLANPLELKFGKDAQVSIGLYRKLTFDDIHAYSCGSDMWNGISMTNQGGEVVGSNSTIEDAKQAIYLLNYGKYTLDNVRFEDDRDGLTVLATNGIANFSESSIKRCTFITVNNLNAPYAGQWGERGIYFSGNLGSNPVTIGTSIIGEENYFEKLRCGIYSYESSLNIYGNRFNNISSNSMAFYSGKGVAAAAHTFQSHINVIGLGSDQALPSYQSCDVGIGISNVTSATVTDQYMKNVTTGILSSGGQFSDLTFSYNKIENANTGISSDLLKSGDIIFSDNDIITNNIVSPSVTVSGISVNDISQALSNDVTITNNTIAAKGHNGIYVSNNNGALVSNNTITQTTGFSVNSYGIRFDNGNAPTISCNSITGNGNVSSSNNKKKSISLSMTKNARLEHNTSSENRIAFEFLSDCNPTAILDNIINNHHYGMYLGNTSTTADIGNQTAQDYGNGQPETPGNDFVGTGSGSFPGYALDGNDNSPGTIYEFNASLEAFYPLSVEISIPFIGSNVSPQPYVSELICEEELQALKSMSETEAEEIASENSTQPNPIEDLITWSQKKGVYSDLKDDSTSATVNEILEIFYDTTSENNIGKLVDAEKNLQTMNDSSLTEADKQQMLDEAQSKVDEVISEKIFESNKQQIYDLIIGKLKEGTDSLTDEEKLLVVTIANQCPFTGGPAVYEARAIRTSFADSIYYDDNEICSQSQKLHEGSNEKTNQALILFPNPADGIYFIQFESQYGQQYRFAVMDFLGKKIYATELSDDQVISISTNFMAAGVYSWRCLAKDNKWSSSGELVIAK